VAAATVFVAQQQRIKNARAEEKRLEREKRISEEATVTAVQRLASSHAANGDRLQAAGDLTGALPWFARALEDEPSGSPGYLARRERLAGALSLCPRMPVFIAHSGPVHSAQWSSDGRRFITASADGVAQVWDAETGVPFVEALRHDQPLRRAELSADSSRAVTLDRAGVARIWNLGNGTATPLASEMPIQSVSISPNGRQILTLTGGAGALLWETGSARARLNLNHGTNILDAHFSPDGTQVATIGADRAVRIWQAEDGRAIAQTIQLDAPVRLVAFSTDGRRILTASGARVAIWNTRTGEASVRRLQHDADISLALFNPDGRQVAIAGADNSVRLWNPQTGTAISLMSAGEAPVTILQFSPDGRWLAVAGGNSIRVLDVWKMAAALPPIHHGGTVRSVEFNPSGHLLLSASDDQSARLTATTLTGWDSFAKTNDLRSELLVSWATLLAANRVSESGRLEPIPPEQLGQIWHSLKSTSAAGFSPFNLGAWHSAEATACERDRDWFGARFHWGAARVLRPGDANCSRQLALAENALAAEEARAARNPATIARIPDRTAETGTNLIDLGPFYNAALTETWFPTNLYAAANDLASLPRGVRRFGGIDFDVRGLIQLSGSALESLGADFPREVGEIPIGRTCRKLHFLHGAGWSALFGTPIGSYFIRYADGEEREVKIIYGQNVRDWWFPTTQPQLTPGAAVAWEGTNAASAPLGQKLRLYQMAWLNPRPDREVRSISFKTMMEKPAPFLLAVTVE